MLSKEQGKIRNRSERWEYNENVRALLSVLLIIIIIKR